MLKTVKKNNAFMAEYFYDGDGKRVKKIENIAGSNITTIYIYQGLTVLYEKTLGNGTVTKYVFGAGKIIAKVKSGATTYFH